jgi:hypothetical protein
VGIYAHTENEYIRFKETFATIEKICTMLKVPPSNKFEYMEKKYTPVVVQNYYNTGKKYESTQTTTGISTTKSTGFERDNSYYSGGYTKYDNGFNYNNFFADSFVEVNFNCWDLVTWFGGTFIGWQHWVEEHASEIKNIQDKVEVYILDLLEEQMTLDIEDSEKIKIEVETEPKGRS